MRTLLVWCACLAAAAVPALVNAQTSANFEGFPDGYNISTEYTGLTFSRAAMLSSGIRLNEFEFPPRSGSNVVSDNGGPITITFAPPIGNFSGYFTYSVPVTVNAFDKSGKPVASTSSKFSNNEALSGISGSSPNELLQVSSTDGIASVIITGSPNGVSFTMDDISTAATPPLATPAPPTLSLVSMALLLVVLRSILTRRRGSYMPTRAIVLIIGTALCGAFGALCLHAAPAPALASPSVGTPVATPAVIGVNTPTTVTVTVAIVTTPIPNGVNLLRLGPAGKNPPILGVMHDDGKNGDAAAGDGIYTLQVSLNEPATGQVALGVSAAFRNNLTRLLAINDAFVVVSSSGLSWNTFSVPLRTGINLYSIQYPPGWTTFSGSGSDEYFSPHTPDVSSNHVGDILVHAISTVGISIDLGFYYSNLAPINFFKKSQSYTTFTTTNGLTAVEFTNVAGGAPSDMISVQNSRAIVEIYDIGEQHHNDGILRMMANTVQ